MEIIVIIFLVIAISAAIFCLLKLKESQKEQAIAQNNLQSAQNLIEQGKNTLEIEIEKKESAISQFQHLKTEIALINQENSALKTQMLDWEKTKEQHITAAKASMLEAGKELSNKLLDDHKREAKQAKEEGEQQIKKTAEDLQKNVTGLHESVKSLNDQVIENRNKVDVVNNALLNPSGAGFLSEITLENLLKNSGLIAEQDYTLQHWIASDNGGLKPDAVVYLPDNNVMVIDSKASQFFLKIEKEQDEQERKILESKLKNSMNTHLKDLIKRDYKKAIEEQLKSQGKIDNTSNITMIMFIPTESALEHLQKIDKKFIDNAHREKIIPASPIGLLNLLHQADRRISYFKQEQNSQKIIDVVKELISNIAPLHKSTDDMGKRLKSAINMYDKFAGSFNRTFMSKVKTLDKLGLGDSKTSALPPLERYQLTNSNGMIELEAEGNNGNENVQELLIDETG